MQNRFERFRNQDQEGSPPGTTIRFVAAPDTPMGVRQDRPAQRNIAIPKTQEIDTPRPLHMGRVKEKGVDYKKRNTLVWLIGGGTTLLTLGTGIGFWRARSEGGNRGSPNGAYLDQPQGIDTSEYSSALAKETTNEHPELGKPGNNIQWIYYGLSVEEYPYSAQKDNGVTQFRPGADEYVLYGNCGPYTLETIRRAYGLKKIPIEEIERKLNSMGYWDDQILYPRSSEAWRNIASKLDMNVKFLFGFGRENTGGEDSMSDKQKSEIITSYINSGHPVMTSARGHWETTYRRGPGPEGAPGPGQFKTDNKGKYYYMVDGSGTDDTWAPNNMQRALTEDQWLVKWNGTEGGPPLALLFLPKDQSKIKNPA